MRSRASVNRSPISDTSGDLQALTITRHGLVVTAVVDPDFALLLPIPFPIAVVDPGLIRRLTGSETFGEIDGIDTVAADIEVCTLGRHDPVVASAAVDMVVIGVALQFVSETRAAQIFHGV